MVDHRANVCPDPVDFGREEVSSLCSLVFESITNDELVEM